MIIEQLLWIYFFVFFLVAYRAFKVAFMIRHLALSKLQFYWQPLKAAIFWPVTVVEFFIWLNRNFKR